jgi:hypothetical protein
MLPLMAMRPTLLALVSVNHTALCDIVIAPGLALGEIPWENSVTTPAGVMRPILFAEFSVNQILPSGPAVMSTSPAFAVMPLEYSVIVPLGVIYPMRFPNSSVNHTLPSGPRVTSCTATSPGERPLVKSVTTPPVVTLPIALVLGERNVNHKL